MARTEHEVMTGSLNATLKWLQEHELELELFANNQWQKKVREMLAHNVAAADSAAVYF